MTFKDLQRALVLLGLLLIAVYLLADSNLSEVFASLSPRLGW